MVPLTITTIVQREITDQSISGRLKRILETARDARKHGDRVSFYGSELIPKVELYQALDEFVRPECLETMMGEINQHLSYGLDSSRVDIAAVLNKYFANPNGYFKE